MVSVFLFFIFPNMCIGKMERDRRCTGLKAQDYSVNRDLHKIDAFDIA